MFYGISWKMQYCTVRNGSTKEIIKEPHLLIEHLYFSFFNKGVMLFKWVSGGQSRSYVKFSNILKFHTCNLEDHNMSFFSFQFLLSAFQQREWYLNFYFCYVTIISFSRCLFFAQVL